MPLNQAIQRHCYSKKAAPERKPPFSFFGSQERLSCKNTTLKRWTHIYPRRICFRPLLNYTTLKQGSLYLNSVTSFRPLLNYTTLKPQIRSESVIEGYSSNGKYAWFGVRAVFSLLRGIVQKKICDCFSSEKLFCLLKQCRPSANYTTLKQRRPTSRWTQSFRPLLNYTTLKPQIRLKSVVEGYSTYIV